jgi:hypothetical protein
MDIDKMIAELQAIRKEHGNLPILGGYLHDDTVPSKISVLNDNGCDFAIYGGEIAGIFLE